MDLNEFAVDPVLYEEGQKIEFGDGSHIRVRAAGSERAGKVRDRLWKPYATWKEVPTDILSKLNAQWLAQGMLTEMVGFTIDGKPLNVDLSKPEDQKKLGDILSKSKFKSFRNKVLAAALEESNFQAAVDEELAKNSGPSPAGSSRGGEGPNK